jgi:hypothetical protein
MLEEEFWRGLEALAQVLDLVLVKLALAAQNFRRNAWRPEHVHEVLLLEAVLVHQEFTEILVALLRLE